MNLNIRTETVEDYPYVFQGVKAAFADAEHTDHDEHHLVERLRKSEAFIPELSLVATADGSIVGHILYTKIHIGDTVALALAPLSVIPEMQGKGIGSELIHAGHHAARALGYTCCVVLGHADYYPRFGYVPASAYGIHPPFDVPDANFMAINLQDEPLQISGVVQYARAFFEK